MKPRVKLVSILGGAAASLSLAFVVYSRVSEAFASRYDRLSSLSTELEKQERAVDRGKRAKKKIVDWEVRALPSDVALASTLYQNWLLNLTDRAKIAEADVVGQSAPRQASVYRKIAFTVNGRGTWEQVVNFLYGFYSAGHLHQIVSLALTPLENGRQIKVVVKIEAVSLPGAKRRELATVPGDRLALADESLYREAIATRSLFAPYTPPPPARVEPVARTQPPPPPKFDDSRHAYITAILESQGEPQVWLKVRTTGETLKLKVGDAFEVGTVTAKVTRIEIRSIEIEVGESRRWIRLGQPLTPDSI